MNKEYKTEKIRRIEINSISATWHSHCIERVKDAMKFFIAVVNHSDAMDET